MPKVKLAATLAVIGAFLAAPAFAEMNVNIGIGIPIGPAPVVVYQAAPEVVVIPGSPVYYAPGLNVDVFFYGGYWWAPNGGLWFRANTYNGPWTGIRKPPVYITNMPRDYRQRVVRERRIPYGHLKKHWRDRERNRRWEHERHEYARDGHGRSTPSVDVRDNRDRDRGGRDRGGWDGGGKHGGGHGRH
jgi:hypothetical protein